MDDIFAVIAGWVKELFGHLVIIVVNVLTVMMLTWATNGNVQALVLSMCFIPVATWAYYIIWRALPALASHGVDISKTQATLITVGLIFSVGIEIVLAGLEIAKLFVNTGEPPAWTPTVVLGTSILAMVIHAILFFIYLGSAPAHNTGLHRAFESDMKRSALETETKTLRRKEIEQDALASEHAMHLTTNLLEASLPIIAEEKARERAYEALRRLGLDNNPRLRALIESELHAYRIKTQTSAVAAGNSVIDAEYRDAEQPADTAANPTAPPKRGKK